MPPRVNSSSLLCDRPMPLCGCSSFQEPQAAEGKSGTPVPLRPGWDANKEKPMNDDNQPTDLRDVQPSSFAHVIGQGHVTAALKIAVEASFQEKKRLDE